MPYGPTKYAAPEMMRFITEVMGDQMSRFSAFTNPSLCYFGAKLKYKIEVELFARGETVEIVQKETTIGATPTMEEQTDPALGIKSEKVLVEGERVAGRVPRPPEAEADAPGTGKASAANKSSRSTQRIQPLPVKSHRGAGEDGGNPAAY